MTEAELEALWERLAEAVDAAGPRHEALFLAKLALLLGRELDLPRVEALIATALRDLE
jgi:hypothetical protein